MLFATINITNEMKFFLNKFVRMDVDDVTTYVKYQYYHTYIRVYLYVFVSIYGVYI